MVLPYHFYLSLTRSQQREDVMEMVKVLIRWLRELKNEFTTVKTDADPEEVQQREDLSM